MFNQHFVSGSVSAFVTIRHGKRNCQSRGLFNSCPTVTWSRRGARGEGGRQNFITSGPGAWALRFIQFNLKSLRQWAALFLCCATVLLCSSALLCCSCALLFAVITTPTAQPAYLLAPVSTLPGKYKIECEPKRHVIKNCLQSSLTRRRCRCSACASLPASSLPPPPPSPSALPSAPVAQCRKPFSNEQQSKAAQQFAASFLPLFPASLPFSAHLWAPACFDFLGTTVIDFGLAECAVNEHQHRHTRTHRHSQLLETERIVALLSASRPHR